MSRRKIKLVMPTGRMSEEVLKLLAEAGVFINYSGKNYRPVVHRCTF